MPATQSQSQMRVSDADRSAAADRLSRHYGEGRLDETAFNDRLDRAMRATTQADLDELFTDLPADPGSEPKDPGPAQDKAVKPAPPIRHHGGRHPAHRLIGLGLLVIAIVAVSHALAHLYIPWLLVAILAFLVLRYGGSRRRRS